MQALLGLLQLRLVPLPLLLRIMPQLITFLSGVRGEEKNWPTKDILQEIGRKGVGGHIWKAQKGEEGLFPVREAQILSFSCTFIRWVFLLFLSRLGKQRVKRRFAPVLGQSARAPQR